MAGVYLLTGEGPNLSAQECSVAAVLPWHALRGRMHFAEFALHKLAPAWQQSPLFLSQEIATTEKFDHCKAEKRAVLKVLNSLR